MSNNGRVPEDPFTDSKEGVFAVSNEFASATGSPLVASSSKTGRFAELQSAMRFPLKLTASVKSATGERSAETQNISANGVLFYMDAEMPIGSTVDFTIALPPEVAGGNAGVRLGGRGRVVRNCEEDGHRGVGVVIDEYRFERQMSAGKD
jgi:PilZ domain-containing protein